MSDEVSIKTTSSGLLEISFEKGDEEISIQFDMDQAVNFAALIQGQVRRYRESGGVEAIPMVEENKPVLN